MAHTVDGRNPANQLSLVVYPIIYKVLYIPGGCLGFLNHQQLWHFWAMLWQRYQAAALPEPNSSSTNRRRRWTFLGAEGVVGRFFRAKVWWWNSKVFFSHQQKFARKKNQVFVNFFPQKNCPEKNGAKHLTWSLASLSDEHSWWVSSSMVWGKARNKGEDNCEPRPFWSLVFGGYFNQNILLAFI